MTPDKQRTFLSSVRRFVLSILFHHWCLGFQFLRRLLSAVPVVLYCSLQDPQYIHSVVNALTHNIGRTSVKCTMCHRLISIPCLGERDSLGVLGKYSTSAGVDLSCDRVGARDNQAGTRLLWGTYHGDSPPMRAPPLPAPAQYRSGENPEHRYPRSHSFSCTFANQRITIT